MYNYNNNYKVITEITLNITNCWCRSAEHNEVNHQLQTKLHNYQLQCSAILGTVLLRQTVIVNGRLQCR